MTAPGREPKSWVLAARTLLGRRESISRFLAVSAMISLVAGTIVWALSPNAPLIVAELESEYVVQKVRRPVLARIPLGEAEHKVGSGCQTAAGGTLHPPESAIVRYRIRDDMVSIEVDHSAAKVPALLRVRDSFGEELDCELKDPVNVFVMPASPDLLLPIAGPAEIGIEFGAPVTSGTPGRRVANLLLGGHLQIFAKTGWGNSLYPVITDEIVVPAGSRLASSNDVTGEEPGDPWYGVAIPEERAFRISATTETLKLNFFRPGRQGESEYFTLSLFTRILGDPSIALVSFLFITFFAVSQVVATAMGLKRWR